jgi:hypothetical protein
VEGDPVNESDDPPADPERPHRAAAKAVVDRLTLPEQLTLADLLTGIQRWHLRLIQGGKK